MQTTLNNRHLEDISVTADGRISFKEKRSFFAESLV